MPADVDELALLIKAVYRNAVREANAALKDVGLTAAQAEALAVLAAAGPLSLQELGGLLIAEGGHPSRLVDRLVAAGLVARAPAAEDRRRVTLELTAAGRRLHARAQRRTAPLMAALADRIDARDAEAAARALRTCLEGTELGTVVARRVGSA